MRIRFIQKFINVLRGKEEFDFVLKNRIKACHKNYKKIIIKIREKVKAGEKIKVGFMVVYDSVFPAENIFKAMLNDEIFEPKIIVIPDIIRGEENQWHNLQKTFSTLSNRYSSVINSYNEEKKAFEDVSTKADIFFFANPYDQMTHDFYSIEYISQKALTCLVPYAFWVTSYIETFVKKVPELKYLWKLFLETDCIKKYYIEIGKVDEKNICVSGYPRTDDLYTIEKINNRRKKIILAPHSVSQKNTTGIEFAEFLKFHDCILKLPRLYPQIDFVFRPHPFLFVNLQNEKIWTKDDVNSYINQMKSYPNVVYQDGGPFAFDFVNSDGIIHDCGSFLPEYLITNNPTCYLQSSKEVYHKYFIELGQRCLDNCYIANTEQKILNFIDNVILNDDDFMQQKRVEFVKNELAKNPGVASKFIIDFLKKQLGVNID